MRIVSVAALLALGIAGCGGASEDEKNSLESVGVCIRNTGREVLVEPQEFLVYDTIRVKAADNEARIDVWDDEDRAKEDVERSRFDEEPERRERFKKIGNAVISWDEVPSEEENQALSGCLLVLSRD